MTDHRWASVPGVVAVLYCTRCSYESTYVRCTHCFEFAVHHSYDGHCCVKPTTFGVRFICPGRRE